MIFCLIFRGILPTESLFLPIKFLSTHLLMNDVNIREVQELLGHKNVETTMIYTHVLRNMSKAPMSPLDSLLIVKETTAPKDSLEGLPGKV